MKCIFQLLLLVILTYPFDSKNAMAAMRKFENPALQFAGTWRVDSHDWREFESAPVDSEKQMEVQAASFPVGQTIRLEWTGLALMPGNYNSERMNSDGPVGETLSLTILVPFEKDLCRGYWSHLCTDSPKNYVKSFMIVEINKWNTAYRATQLMWPDVKPVEYNLVDLSKSHNIDVWFDKKGDMIMTIYIDGQSKSGTGFGMMGVRLKRIK